MTKEKFVTFLYLLMRDAAPTGEIVRILKELDSVNGDCKFSSPELEAYARRLTEQHFK
jgi:hypothetical protein